MKKTLLWASGVLSMLLVALAIHIYISTAPNVQDKRVRYMGRIDFKQDIDTLEANKIRGYVQSLDGIESSHFNIKDDLFVFTYFPAKIEKQTVFENVMSFGNYKADLFVADNAKNIASCPVMGKSSFLYRASVYFSNLRYNL